MHHIQFGKDRDVLLEIQETADPEVLSMVFYLRANDGGWVEMSRGTINASRNVAVTTR